MFFPHSGSQLPPISISIVLGFVSCYVAFGWPGLHSADQSQSPDKLPASTSPVLGLKGGVCCQPSGIYALWRQCSQRKLCSAGVFNDQVTKVIDGGAWGCWGDGSEVRSTGCSSRGFELHSHHSHDSSQLSLLQFHDTYCLVLATDGIAHTWFTDIHVTKTSILNF